MSDLTPLQLVSLIALGAAVLNFARALLSSGGSATARSSPLPPIRKAPSPLAKPGTPAAAPPKPGAAPVGKQEVLPGSSLDSGIAGHVKAGAAKTVKLPSVPPKGTDGQPQPATEAMPLPPPATPVVSSKPRISTGGTSVVEGKPSDADAAALDSLFGKADAPDIATGLPGETKTGAIKRKASRLGELGFHHSIQPEDTDSGSKPAIGAAPRSSTAELTSILERIDKFLAEDTPPKATDTLKPGDAAKPEATAAPPATLPPPATMPTPAPLKPGEQSQIKTEPIPAKPADAEPAKPDPSKKTQPLWARADAQDEDVKPAADDKGGDEKKADPGQQRLF
jgi:hypothetical protein